MREIFFLSLLGSTRAKLKCPKFAEPACVPFDSMIADCNGAFNATRVAPDEEFFDKEEIEQAISSSKEILERCGYSELFVFVC